MTCIILEINIEENNKKRIIKLAEKLNISTIQIMSTKRDLKFERYYLLNNII